MLSGYVYRKTVDWAGRGVCMCVSTRDESGCLCVHIGVFSGQESRYVRFGPWGWGVAMAGMSLLFSNHSEHLRPAHS